MVYSIRTNGTFATKAPLQMTRKQTDWSKTTRQFALDHSIEFHMSHDGVPSVKVTKKDE